MRRTGPKTRLARRVGEALRDKDVKYLQKRNYPPGMHGQSRIRRSEYGTQLLEKQKAKWTYLVNERQFRRYVERSRQNKALTSEVLLQSLELRLDNVAYRLGFATSRAQGRQIASHGFLTVNGKKVDIPSYALKVGDSVGINSTKRATKFVAAREPALKDFKTQEWLSLQPKDMVGKVLAKPTMQSTGSTLQMDRIIEHYSR